MGFRLPTGDNLNLPQAPNVQGVHPVGGDQALAQANRQQRQSVQGMIGGAIDFASQLVEYKREAQIDRAQTEYIDRVTKLQLELKENPRNAGLDDGARSQEDIAYPNLKYFKDEKKKIAEDVQDKHLKNFFGGSTDFSDWRERYDISGDSKVKSMDIDLVKKDQMDALSESVTGLVNSTTAENVGNQYAMVEQKVRSAVDKGLLDPTEGDNLLDDAFKDITGNAIKAQLNQAIAEEDFETAEDIVNNPDNYTYETYDEKRGYIDERQREAFRSYVEGEKKQHLYELDKQEEELANTQYRTLVDDWLENSPEKMKFMIQDSGKYKTFFNRNPREYERWLMRIESIQQKQQQEAQERQEDAQEREDEARDKSLERRREYAVKDIERKIEARVDHDEVDRLINRYAENDLFDSDLMSEYFRRNESRNPDPVREWIYTEIDNLTVEEAEKAKITERVQAELARMNMQGEGANLSMEDAQKIYNNIKDPVVENRAREIINNRVVQGIPKKTGRSLFAAAAEVSGGDEYSLTQREQLTRSLYEDKVLYGTANPKVISSIAFEENLGDEDEIYDIVAPNYNELSKREQKIVQANVNAGIVARAHYNDYVEKWGTDRIENTYVTGLGTLVIETDYGRFRRITEKDSNRSKWQYKAKEGNGFSEIWRDYEWGE